MIEKLIKQWKDEAECRGVIQYNYSYATGILTLYTGYPGYLIGGAGVLFNKYLQIFKDEIHEFDSIKFVETNLKYIE